MFKCRARLRFRVRQPSSIFFIIIHKTVYRSNSLTMIALGGQETFGKGGTRKFYGPRRPVLGFRPLSGAVT